VTFLNERPAVSVVIPAYNAASFIERTLDSVLAQTFEDYEIVVVDDGSTDGTRTVVDRYIADRKLRGMCLTQPNKRIAAARNAGMRAARAPIIALLDHDDIWLPEKLAKTMKAFAEHPEAGLVGHHIVMVRAGRQMRIFRKGPAGERMYERLLLEGNAVSPSAASFKKDLALSIGGFREEERFNTVEDYDFWLRLSKVCLFYFIDEVLSQYTVVDGGASRKIEYHHQNLETLLQEHFASHFGSEPKFWDRLRMRRRMSAVYRSAAGALIESSAPPEVRKEYVVKMLREFPFDVWNLGRTAHYLATAAAEKIIARSP